MATSRAWESERGGRGESLGEHALAGAGAADEEKAVVSGGGDLDCPPGLGLAADVGEVGVDRGLSERRRLSGNELEGLGAAEVMGDL